MNGDLNQMLAHIASAEGLGRNVAKYGVRLAIDLLQQLLADLEGGRPEENARRFLAGLNLPSRHGRPRKSAGADIRIDTKKTRRSGWPSDPAARRKEMLRRQAVARARKVNSGRSAGARKAWASKTPAQRKAWAQAIQQARRASVANRLNGAAQ